MILDAFLFTGTDTIHYSPYVETRTFPSPNEDIPTLAARIAYNFTAKGTFSAENPITVSVCVSDVNTTNLLQYYGALGFFGSVFYSSSSHYIGGEEQNGYVVLKPAQNGTYVGTSTLIWPVESDVYTYLVPIPSLFSSSIQIGPNSTSQTIPTMHVTSSLDTFNGQFNELTTKLTLIIVGFSILMLQPVLEALFHLKNED